MLTSEGRRDKCNMHILKPLKKPPKNYTKNNIMSIENIKRAVKTSDSSKMAGNNNKKKAEKLIEQMGPKETNAEIIG